MTGPGGTGKTRLAAQAAGELAEEYRNGVWWIPLAPLRDPALVVETAAQTLGAQDGLVDHIGDKSMLLLFDNFEQVINAAGDVATLLVSCPNLDVLVTSRRVFGESVSTTANKTSSPGRATRDCALEIVNPESVTCTMFDRSPLAGLIW